MAVMWLATAWVMTCMTPPGDAGDQLSEQTRVIVDAFVVCCTDSSRLNDEQNSELISTAASQLADRESAQAFMTTTLGVMYPCFQDAVNSLGEEQTGPAIANLNGLADTDNPYLAAQVNYFLARAYIMGDDYDQALPLLDRLTGEMPDQSLFTAESVFLRGVCEAQLLLRGLAIQTLTVFVNQFPEAPERLIVGAKHLIAELQAVEEGSLTDVRDRMALCQRRLQLEYSGTTTQQHQSSIIAMLEILIGRAEESEKNQSQSRNDQRQAGTESSQAGSTQSNVSSTDAASDSFAPEGEGRVESLDRMRGSHPADTWGQLPPREREKVQNILQENFPDRYRELVEQYFRSFQVDEDR